MNDLVNCLKCDFLPKCCTAGTFRGPWRKLVLEEEADVYGRHLLSPVPGETGLYVHEHNGPCPHADRATGLCAIHEKGKPAWCIMHPVSLVGDDVLLDFRCAPFVNQKAYKANITRVREFLKTHPYYTKALQDLGQDHLNSHFKEEELDIPDVIKNLLMEIWPRQVIVIANDKTTRKWNKYLKPGPRGSEVVLHFGGPVLYLCINALSRLTSGGGLPYEDAFLYILDEPVIPEKKLFELLRLGWVELPGWGEHEGEHLFKRLSMFGLDCESARWRYDHEYAKRVDNCQGCDGNIQRLMEAGAKLPVWCPKAPLELYYHYRHRGMQCAAIATSAPTKDLSYSVSKTWPPYAVSPKLGWYNGLQLAMWSYVTGDKKVIHYEGNSVPLVLGLMDSGWAWEPITSILRIPVPLTSKHSHLFPALEPNVYMDKIWWNGKPVEGMFPTDYPLFIAENEEASVIIARHLSGTAVGTYLEAANLECKELHEGFSRVMDPAVAAALVFFQENGIQTYVVRISQGASTLGHVAFAQLSYQRSLPIWFRVYSDLDGTFSDEISDVVMMKELALERGQYLLNGVWPLNKDSVELQELAIVDASSWTDYGHQFNGSGLVVRR